MCVLFWQVLAIGHVELFVGIVVLSWVCFAHGLVSLTVYRCLQYCGWEGLTGP